MSSNTRNNLLPKNSSPGCVGGWVDGWMNGWMGGWRGVKAGFRIAYSTKRTIFNLVTVMHLTEHEKKLKVWSD